MQLFSEIKSAFLTSQAMASIDTILPFKSRLLSKSGTTVFSLDFKSTFCCPKISIWSETQALNRQSPDFL